MSFGKAGGGRRGPRQRSAEEEEETRGKPSKEVPSCRRSIIARSSLSDQTISSRVRCSNAYRRMCSLFPSDRQQQRARVGSGCTTLKGTKKEGKPRTNDDDDSNPSLSHTSSLTFLWYRLKPHRAAAAEAHADEEEDEDELAVSDDAPRSARSKDCDLISKANMFFCVKSSSAFFPLFSLFFSSLAASHALTPLSSTHAPTPAHARRSILRRQGAGEKTKR